MCDVASAAGGEAFVAAATEALGGLDILVTNAGGPPPGTFASTDVDAYPAAIDLNLLSIVGDVQGRGAGDAGRRLGPRRRHHVARRAPADAQPDPVQHGSGRVRPAFLKTLAREVAADGVTVNSVQPGLHWTDRVHGLYPDGPGDVPMGDADDFGAIVAFLCGDAAKFLTGAQVHVDGGAYQALL